MLAFLFKRSQGVLENNDINDQVMQCVNEGVVIISPHGQIVNVNKSASLIFGVPFLLCLSVSNLLRSVFLCRLKARASWGDT